MKGIKEIMMWLLDNPMKEIKHVYEGGERGYHNVRYHDYTKAIEVCDPYKNIWVTRLDMIGFDEEWQEVITPIEWQEAIQDCLENGTEYLSWYGEGHKYNGDTWIVNYFGEEVRVSNIFNKNRNSIAITCKWVKK